MLSFLRQKTISWNVAQNLILGRKLFGLNVKIYVCISMAGSSTPRLYNKEITRAVQQYATLVILCTFRGYKFHADQVSRSIFCPEKSGVFGILGIVNKTGKSWQFVCKKLLFISGLDTQYVKKVNKYDW